MKLYRLKTYLVLVFIIIVSTVKAQDNLIGASFGGGTFSMNSTKEFNDDISSGLPFKTELTTNFPPYFFYKAEVLHCFKNFALGVNVSSTSTGSRLSYADYSGSYKLDNVQHGLFAGIKILDGQAPGKVTGFNLGLECGVAFSKMKMDEKMKVFDQTISDSTRDNSMGLYVQPGVYYFIVPKSHFRFSANVSYYFGIEKGYHLPNKKDAQLINPDTQKQIKPQWDGVRIGVTAYWVLRK
jgi:hypothetical protein